MANGLFNLKQVMQGIQQSAWVSQKPPAVDYLIVAGGGGGATSGSQNCGGGGAGGLLAGSVNVATSNSYTVTVGAGGTTSAVGGNSVFGSISAAGGGWAGNQAAPQSGGNGNNGGSGGGGNSYPSYGGSGILGQGNAGGRGFDTNYSAGGGGGAGAVGYDGTKGYGGSGGAGVSSAITGSLVSYAGGGGGQSNGTSGSGGVGGGGGLSTAGTANTGGGGGGGGPGGAGGSGIVILSYPDTFAAAASTTGSPTVSTSGSGSIVFDGSGDYVRYPTSTNYAFASGDFTVEAFIYRSNLDGMIVDARSGALSQTWCLYLSGANLGWINGSGNPSTSTTVAGTTWTHVAACRSGTTFKLFINGVAGYTGSDSINYTTTSPLLVGINADLSSNPFSGYISNVRITKGTAVYTADFTPPTAPLTKLTNTGLLLNTVSGAVFADSATGATTSGIGGQVAWNASSPFTVTGYKNRVYTWTSSGSITF